MKKKLVYIVTTLATLGIILVTAFGVVIGAYNGAYSDMGLPQDQANQLNAIAAMNGGHVSDADFARIVGGTGVKGDFDHDGIPDNQQGSKPAQSSAPKTNTGTGTTKTSNRAHYHDFEETVTKEPTCTEPGEKTLTCKIKNELTGKDPCGFTQGAEIPALGHDDGQWITTVEPTCTEPGHKELRCTRCNELLDEEDIPATGHDEGEWSVETEPTCTKEGKKVLKCTKCGEVLDEETVPAKGHIPGEWEVAKPANWIHNGEQVRKCTVCGEVLETQTIPANHMPLYIIGGIAILCIGIIAAFIIKKKSQKA